MKTMHSICTVETRQQLSYRLFDKQPKKTSHYATDFNLLTPRDQMIPTTTKTKTNPDMDFL
jgi:hypothetical protein